MRRTARMRIHGRRGHAGARLGTRIAVASVVMLTLGAAGWSGTAAAQTSADTVVRVHLDGVVDPLVADYLDGAIGRAASAGDQAVLLEIDTPGGLVSSMRQITQSILNADIPVIGYVAPQGARAASAGAYVLMSTPVAAMAPGTNVGAATPVGLNGAIGSEKAVNDAAASMTSLAEQRGRNAQLAASFVTDAVSISAQQALDENIIDLIAGNETELLNGVDGTQVTLANGTSVTLATAGATVVDESMGGFTGFLHSLLDPNLAFLFFWLGLALIVLELLVPGHIFSGTVGTILLILAFVSFGLLPVRLLGLLLLVGAVVAFIAEAAKPGLGVWGVLGLIFLVLGGWFLYDRAGGGGVSPWVILPVAAGIALFFGVAITKVRAMRDLPPLPLGSESVIGREGVALSSGLNPKGVVRVDAEEWHAVSSAGRIPGGARVRVTRLDGLVLTVEPVESEHAPASAPPMPDLGGGNAP
jgi:membrane-bound serine protease (ClpP class)